MIRKSFSLSLFILMLMIYLAYAASGVAQSTGAQPETSYKPPATTLPAATRAPRTQDVAEPVSLPIIPVIIEFEYAPKYFIQWMEGHPKYSMIEGVVMGENPAVYQLVLTRKGEGIRVYYSNNEAHVKALSQEGKTARQTPIEYRVTPRIGEEPIHEFGFKDEEGQSIRWKFIPASEVSERGGGLAPGRRKGLSFIYRKLGTAAGEGASVQVGEAVINAAPWPQISAPPYFVAYRGAYSTNSIFAGLVLGSESWQLKTAPAALKEGEKWVLTDGRNNKREFRIVSRKADELTIREVREEKTLELIARATPQGLALRTVSTRSADRHLSISFKPELNLSAAPAGEIGFQVDLSGSGKPVEGSIQVAREGNNVSLKWQPRSPNWTKQFMLHSLVTIDPKSYRLEVK